MAAHGPQNLDYPAFLCYVLNHAQQRYPPLNPFRGACPHTGGNPMARLPTNTVAALFLLIAVSAPAATLHVPDEYPTIQSAIEAAADDDLVLVAQDTYVENINFLAKSITIESEAGPDVTIIDGSGLTAGSVYGATVRIGAPWPGSELRGFTITGGTGELIYGNRWGGGIVAGTVGETRRCTIDDCVVTGNTALLGGGIAVYQGSDGVIENTRVEGNHADERGGGIWFNQTHNSWDVRFCLIANNTVFVHGGGIHVDMAASPSHVGPDIENCTIVGNTAYSGLGGGVFCSRHSGPDLLNCLITDSPIGHAVYCAEGSGSVADPILVCCNLYGNAGGDWNHYWIQDQYGVNGNISVDPLYCGDQNPDEPYSPREDSPCVPENNAECGLIGAIDIGCGFSPVESSSWGRIKSQYQ
jgi:hypothetical protein